MEDLNKILDEIKKRNKKKNDNNIYSDFKECDPISISGDLINFENAINKWCINNNVKFIKIDCNDLKIVELSFCFDGENKENKFILYSAYTNNFSLDRFVESYSNNVNINDKKSVRDSERIYEISNNLSSNLSNFYNDKMPDYYLTFNQGLYLSFSKHIINIIKNDKVILCFENFCNLKKEIQELFGNYLFRPEELNGEKYNYNRKNILSFIVLKSPQQHFSSYFNGKEWIFYDIN